MGIRDVLHQLRMQREGVPQTIKEASLALFAQERLALLLFGRLFWKISSGWHQAPDRPKP
jgi:hypothetical protein